jgi:uncharacterized protein (DUF433 family)
MNKPSESSPVPTGKPAELDPSFHTARASSVQPSPATSEAMNPEAGPRLVFRDGVADLQEYDIPVWRLEMARRGGSSPEALMGAFPGLTREGLDLAFAYAQEHRAEFDPLIQYHSGADVPLEEEADDEDDATFEAELDAMFTEYAQVFRRLAE